MSARDKMCGKKVSFYNKKKAQVYADKYNQRVYECPVCFCFHCTSKDSWREEFVPVEKYKKIVEQQTQLINDYKNYREYKRIVGHLTNDCHNLYSSVRKTVKSLQR